MEVAAMAAMAKAAKARNPFGQQAPFLLPRRAAVVVVVFVAVAAESICTQSNGS